ncbi:MAG TPA: hypothetical protein VMS08_05310 [Candidatus Saccharimonadia bacterium]|nr:hypothetical protein [Candidatus Saccharimonadia bacterium]
MTYQNMDLLSRMEHLKRLFSMFLPKYETPSLETLRIWDSIELPYIEIGITRAASRKTKTPTENVYRYITAVARSEQRDANPEKAGRNG